MCAKLTQIIKMNILVIKWLNDDDCKEYKLFIIDK